MASIATAGPYAAPRQASGITGAASLATSHCSGAAARNAASELPLFSRLELPENSGASEATAVLRQALQQFGSGKPVLARQEVLAEACRVPAAAVAVIPRCLASSSLVLLPCLRSSLWTAGGRIWSNDIFHCAPAEAHVAAILDAVLYVLQSTDDKLAAKLALWGLSRQELPASLVTARCGAILRPLLPALALDNRWQSFECVLFGATALARLGDRCWAALVPRAGDWLRPFAALLLAAPPPHRMELPEAHRCFVQLRGIAAAALSRWLALGPGAGAEQLVPLPAPLEAAFASDITFKLAPKAQEFVDALLEPKLRPAPSPDGPSPADVRRLDVGLAAAGVTAAGTYFQLLGGSSFSRRIGQPLLTLLEKAFQYREEYALPVAAFGAWQGLMRAAASSGLLAAKARLLAQPLQHALAANSRPETMQHALAANSRPGTLQAMLDAWSQLVALASAVPAGGAPALAKPAAMETFVMAPLRAVAGRRAPGSNRTGTLHARLIEPMLAALEQRLAANDATEQALAVPLAAAVHASLLELSAEAPSQSPPPPQQAGKAPSSGSQDADSGTRAGTNNSLQGVPPSAVPLAAALLPLAGRLAGLIGSSLLRLVHQLEDCPGEPGAALQEALAGPATQLGCLLRLMAAAEAAAGETHPVAWLPACLRPVMDATERLAAVAGAGSGASPAAGALLAGLLKAAHEHTPLSALLDAANAVPLPQAWAPAGDEARQGTYTLTTPNGSPMNGPSPALPFSCDGFLDCLYSCYMRSEKLRCRRSSTPQAITLAVAAWRAAPRLQPAAADVVVRVGTACVRQALADSRPAGARWEALVTVRAGIAVAPQAQKQSAVCMPLWEALAHGAAPFLQEQHTHGGNGFPDVADGIAFARWALLLPATLLQGAQAASLRGGGGEGPQQTLRGWTAAWGALLEAMAALGTERPHGHRKRHARRDSAGTNQAGLAAARSAVAAACNGVSRGVLAELQAAAEPTAADARLAFWAAVIAPLNAQAGLFCFSHFLDQSADARRQGVGADTKAADAARLCTLLSTIGAAMESQAARLAALPPPVLPGAVVPPSREGWRQRPPDAAMDALHGWLSSAAMTRLLNLRIVDGDDGARALLARLAPPLGRLLAFVLRYWPHLQAHRSGGPFARAVVSVWRQTADFLITHRPCITKEDLSALMVPLDAIEKRASADVDAAASSATLWDDLCPLAADVPDIPPALRDRMPPEVRARKQAKAPAPVPHLNALDSFLPGTAGGPAASPQAARAGPAAAASPAAPASDARPSNPGMAAPADAVAAQQPAEAKAAAKPAAKVKPAAKSTPAAARPAKRSFLDCVAESQTEYVQMPTSVKKRSGVLTERQKEVAAEQRRGAARHGVTTGTLADASQSAWSIAHDATQESSHVPSAAEAVPQLHGDGAAPLDTEQPAATAAAPECPSAKAESAQLEGGKPNKPQAAETPHNKENVSQNPSQQDPSQDAAPHAAENQLAGEASPATPKGAAIKPHSKAAADAAGGAEERAGGAPGAGAAKDAGKGGATAGAAGSSPLPSSSSPVTPSPRAASSGPAAQRAKTGASAGTASSERTRAAGSADAAAAGKGAGAAAGAVGAADAKAEGGKGGEAAAGVGRWPQPEADMTLEAGAAAAAAAAAAAGVGGSGELVITRSGRRAHITPIPLAPLDPQVSPPARGRGAAEWEEGNKISGDKPAADKHGRSSQNGGGWRSAQRQSAAKRSLSSRGAKMAAAAAAEPARSVLSPGAEASEAAGEQASQQSPPLPPAAAAEPEAAAEAAAAAPAAEPAADAEAAPAGMDVDMDTVPDTQASGVDGELFGPGPLAPLSRAPAAPLGAAPEAALASLPGAHKASDEAWAAIGELASDLGGDDASRSPQKLPLSARRPAPPAAESADPPAATCAAADIAAAPSAFAAPAADRSAEASKAPAPAAPALPSPAAAVARNPTSTAPTEEEARELDVEPTQAPAGALDSEGLQAPARLAAELLQRKADVLRQASPQLAAVLAADMAPQPLLQVAATVPAQAGASAAQTASPSGAGAARGGTGGAKRRAEDALQPDAGAAKRARCGEEGASPLPQAVLKALKMIEDPSVWQDFELGQLQQAHLCLAAGLHGIVGAIAGRIMPPKGGQ